MKAQVELIGGPLDGETGYKKLIDEPGKFPLYVHRGRKGKRYVYQANRFANDAEAANDAESPMMRMDFVQILMPGDEI